MNYATKTFLEVDQKHTKRTLLHFMWSPPQTFFGMSRNAPPKKGCSEPNKFLLEKGGGGGGKGGNVGKALRDIPKMVT